MPAKSKGAVVVIGDSHSRTLADGCAALGLETHAFSISGQAWFQGKIHPSKEHGIMGTPGPPRKKMRALLDEMGVTNIFDKDLPFLCSFGFNLGRVNSAISVHGHKAFSDMDPKVEGDDISISTAFLRTYLEHHSGRNFRVAKNIAKNAPLVMVVPPRTGDTHNRRTIIDFVSTRYRQFGIDVVDPGDKMVTKSTGVLPKKYLNPDQIHGNEDYGKKVVGDLIKDGVLVV